MPSLPIQKGMNVPVDELQREKQMRSEVEVAIGTHGNVMTLMMNYFDSTYGLDFLVHTSKPDIYRMEIVNNQLKEVKRLWKE